MSWSVGVTSLETLGNTSFRPLCAQPLSTRKVWGGGITGGGAYKLHGDVISDRFEFSVLSYNSYLCLCLISCMPVCLYPEIYDGGWPPRRNTVGGRGWGQAYMGENTERRLRFWVRRRIFERSLNPAAKAKGFRGEDRRPHIEKTRTPATYHTIRWVPDAGRVRLPH